MASWEPTPDSTPEVKFENSPAESFMSMPGAEMYSLFSTPAPPTMHPMESVMTPQSPQSVDDVDVKEDDLADTPEADGEKKTTKKRKSWGQVLPEPKTNLPPRKRAKTEDEKEQRRVERVLRNRRAAQSSRERKRQEVEALEKRNQELEALLNQQVKKSALLAEELSHLRRQSGVPPSSSPMLDLEDPITLSQPLFPASEVAETKPSMMNDFILMPDNEGTVDPASLSPELTPVSDDAIAKPAPQTSAPAPSTLPTSTDATQHPAAVLCDLQCPSTEVPESLVAQQSPHPALALMLQYQMVLMASSVISACQQPILLIAGALKHNLVLRATPSILSTIIWMVTLPQNFRSSTSHNSLTTITAAQLQARSRVTPRSLLNPSLLSTSSTLRLKSLQKILTSSPMLARPLKDATLGLLRLVSEGHDDRVEGLADRLLGIKGDQGRVTLLWPDGASLPSREALLTLLWAIRVEERNMKAREATIDSQPASDITGSNVPQEETNQTNVSPVSSLKRKRDMTAGSSKRLRLHY